jgi:hypothetical protein
MNFLLLLSLLNVDGRVTVRLLDPVSSVHSRVGDHIRAVMVSPPTGIQTEGVLTEIKRIEGKQKRAEIRVQFERGQAALLEVDNARETVSDDGVIQGMPLLRAAPSKTESAILLAAYAHPVLVALLAVTQITRREVDKPEITFLPGTEMVLKWSDPLPDSEGARLLPLPDLPEAQHLVHRLPTRTATRAGTPSDITNLLFVGDRKKLEDAFLAAGWTRAQHMTPKAAAKGLLAIADAHAFKQAPVSPMALSGRLPDLVFEKQNDTLAKRHHIRIWRQEDTLSGQPVWLAAATHDTGIEFSKQKKWFTHCIDPSIDLERQKIIDDLTFVRSLRSFGQIDRPNVPTSGQNATGGKFETDGKIALLVLR